MTTTITGSENYQCKVVKISEYKKHPNADKLYIINVDHNSVITGVEPKIGDRYMYFPVMSKINAEFLSYINGFDKPEMNKDQSVKGFFTSKCRVKPIKLRGLPSEGYLHPVSALESFLGDVKGHYIGLEEGQEFNEIFGETICEKYIVHNDKRKGNTSSAGKQEKKRQESRLIDGQFAFHNSTSNLRKNLHNIDPQSIIEISYKKHGTSLVCSNVLVKRKLSWLERLGKRLGVSVKDTEYDIIVSSRKVIKNGELNNKTSHNHYYGIDVWGLAAEKIKDKIPKGYSLYCEIIGFTPDGGFIQKGYDYGCGPGEFKVYVYKITNTNEDGFVVNLTTNQIKQFCDKYNLLFSDTLRYYGVAEGLIPRPGFKFS